MADVGNRPTHPSGPRHLRASRVPCTLNYVTLPNTLLMMLPPARILPCNSFKNRHGYFARTTDESMCGFSKRGGLFLCPRGLVKACACCCQWTSQQAGFVPSFAQQVRTKPPCAHYMDVVVVIFGVVLLPFWNQVERPKQREVR